MRQIRDKNYINKSILDDYSLFASKMAREVPPPLSGGRSLTAPGTERLGVPNKRSVPGAASDRSRL
jgi:hypothetical protein